MANKITLKNREKLREELEKLVVQVDEINDFMGQLPHNNHGQATRSLNPKKGEYLSHFDGNSEGIVGKYRSKNGEVYTISVSKEYGGGK